MEQQLSNYEQAKAISMQFTSANECNSIIQKFNCNLTPVLQQPSDISKSAYRSVLIKNVDINEITLLKDTVLSANSQVFKFNLHNKADCFFAQYATDMHYDQLHLDCITGPLQRKLSFSLLLNDEFEGGNFELLGPATIEKLTGKLIVFPSYLPHRVTRITSGTRYVIFGWFYGPHYI